MSETQTQCAYRYTVRRGDSFYLIAQRTGVQLRDLLEANPGNRLAQEYLLCYDLLRYDLEHFMEDLPGTPVEARIYQEAIMVWLSQHNSLTPERAARYGIDVSAFNRMNNFFSNPERYRNTYWYYYTQASKRSNP